jgi:hypothetical protein
MIALPKADTAAIPAQTYVPALISWAPAILTSRRDD